MFEIGDMIVYEGSNSVCRVSDITGLAGQGDGDRLYYVLKPLQQDCVIYNPVDNTQVFMRPVITREEAERLIDTIPEMEDETASTTALRFQETKQIAQHYDAIIKTRDCARLMQLTKSIYRKKQAWAKSNRSLGAVEAAAMKRAEEVLFGELSVALEIPRERVQTYIEARIGDKRERTHH